MAKILVVDDSRLTRRMIASALVADGHDVLQAANGLEALEAFRAHTPDCVVSDLLMPEMDGFELAEQLRICSPETPVLIATADIQERSHTRCRELGVVRLLNKPIKSQELQAAVHDALVGQGAC